MLIMKFPHVFGPRWPEWLGALAATLAGMGLLHPYPAFTSPAFAVFEVWPEEAWGCLLLIVGLLRFTALIINGRRRRVTPWMRLAGAAITFVVFLGLSAGLFLSGSFSTWPGGWPVLALMEFVNIIRASSDARINYDGSH